MPTILVVGATRGLGASIVEAYAGDANNHILATARTSDPPADSMSLSIPQLSLILLDSYSDMSTLCSKEHRLHL
jgi:NAD(P)-dependent dehydrogenase (short-subunit alcohol dehydrogenase family)